jgi:hypothetical protein
MPVRDGDVECKMWSTEVELKQNKIMSSSYIISIDNLERMMLTDEVSIDLNTLSDSYYLPLI